MVSWLSNDGSNLIVTASLNALRPLRITRLLKMVSCEKHDTSFFLIYILLTLVAKVFIDRFQDLNKPV